MNLPWGKKRPVSTQSDENLSSEFILGAVEDGVVMVGSDRVLHIFNQAASQTTGWPVSEALGLDHRSVLMFADAHGKPLPPEQDPIDKVLSSNKSYRDNKLMVRSRSNKLIPISLILSPVVGGSGNSVVGVFRDITAEKVEEEKRSDFISTASHEMRTPIAAIEGYLALALNPKVSKIDDHAKQYLEKAHNATQHLGELFADLLTSTKAEDGRLSSYPVVVELGEIVQQVAESSRFNAEKKGLQMRYSASTPQDGAAANRRPIRPLFYVHVDPNRIREVLQNLIDNALKYTVEGGVTVFVTGNDNIAQVQIQDTGQGIADEDMPHLFQKFYRVDNSMTRSVGGTGLGLFICRQILELYNGQIWVESQVGKGSIFFINLPRLNSTQALEQQRHEAATTSPLDATSRQAT